MNQVRNLHAHLNCISW